MLHRAFARCARRLFLACCLVAVHAAVLPAQDDKSAASPALRVLIIGNSQMYYNDLPKILEALSESAPADRPRITTDRVLNGGYTLERHWNDGDGKDTARGKIAGGKWDFVVVQEWGGTADWEKTIDYARRFQELIQQHGAKTVLVAHANFPGRFPQGFEELHSQFLALAKELKVPLASGGKSWVAYLGDKPTEQELLDLYHPDKGHPGPKGSYLYACTLYATVTGKMPAAASTVVHGSHGAPKIDISEAEAKRCAEATSKVWQELSESK